MKLFEVLDVVRENVGRDKISDPQLRWAVERGLRELEKRDNWYWMEASTVFEGLEDRTDQVYSIRDDLLIEDWKDNSMLLISNRSDTQPSWSEVVGPEPLLSRANFAESDSSCPGFYSILEENDDPSIVLWPTVLDADYRLHLYYYRWTSLPTDVKSSDHEVLRRWPEALIYLATEQGILAATKDEEAATFWRLRFDNPQNQAMRGELKTMQLYQIERKTRKRFGTSPSNGATTMGGAARELGRNWF